MSRLTMLGGCCLWSLLCGMQGLSAKDTAAILAPTPNPFMVSNTETATSRLKASFDQFVKHLDQKEYSLATAELESLINTHHNRSFTLYALTHLPGHDKDKTAEVLERATLSNPSDPALYRLRGYVAKMGFDDRAALEHLNKAIQLDETNATAFFMRSNCWRGATGFDPNQDFFLVARQTREKQLTDINRAIELDSKASQFFLSRGEVKAEMDDKDGALADIQTAMSLTPDQCECLMARATIHSRLGDYSAAAEDCTAAIAAIHQHQLQNSILRHREVVDYTLLLYYMDPEICECYTQRGRAKLELKDFRGALDDFNVAYDLGSFSSNSVIDARADAYIGLKDFQSALKDLTRLGKEKYPMLESDRLAWVKLQLKDYQGALDQYNIALKYDEAQGPASIGFMWEAFNGRGMAKQHLGDLDGAFEDFNIACEFGSYSHLPFLARGSLYLEQKDITKALADLEEAVDNEPDDVSAHFQRGLAYHAKQRYGEAIEDFNLVIRLQPENAATFFNRGLSQRADSKRADSKLAESIVSFDAAITLDPTNHRSFYFRGLSKHDSGDEAAAIADYDSALAIDPKYTNAYIQRAASHSKLNNFKSALADYDAALALDADSLKAITGKSILLSTCSDASLRDFTAASELANHAIEIDPNDPQAISARASADAAKK